MLYTASDLAIMVLFLVIAQGWRLTDDVPPRRDQVLIGIAIVVYVVCYTIIYSVDYSMRDPAAEVYVLLSTGAFFLAVIRIMCVPGPRLARVARRSSPPSPRRLFLLCALFFVDTYRREPSVHKLAFFRRTLVCCALWFLQMPVNGLIAMFTSQWVRHRVATAVMGVTTTSILGYMLFCFQPERAKDYFTITAAEVELEGLNVREADAEPAIRSSLAGDGPYTSLHEEATAAGVRRRDVADEGML